MTVWSARAAMFPGLSLLATVCLAGCGTGSGDGHQAREGDAAAPSPAAEAAGGGGGYFASEIGRKMAEAGIGRSGEADASGATGATGSSRSTSGGERPTAEAGAPEPDKPSCVPEAGIDEPDEDFVDSNCDGIDGDAAAAVFVAPSGHDEAEGSMDAPFETVTHAVAIAAAAGKSVYLCDAKYSESIELAGTAVSIYGGYACDRGWRREIDRATLEPPRGIPFVAKAVAAPMVVERVAFKAPAAVDPSESSIAASIVGSKQIRFVRVLVQASTGQDGKGGKPVFDPPRPFVRQAPAANASPLVDADYCVASRPGSPDWYGDANCNLISAGGVDVSRTCPDGTEVRGGNGGYGGNFFWGIPLGEAGSPGIPAASERDGAPGAPGDFGEGASGFGEIADGVYVASKGKNGRYGRSGESGRGGDGGWDYGAGGGDVAVRYAPGGGGGQGGYAGCGGHGGNRGYSGGASLALIAVDSGISVEWSTLETGRGGDGGDGSDGLPGQPGGRGGKGAPGSGGAFKGADGGRGADGGHGGSGGPGGGGPSVGIVWIGKEPATSNVTFELGSPGRGGTSPSTDAADGVGAETYSPAEAGTTGK